MSSRRLASTSSAIFSAPPPSRAPHSIPLFYQNQWVERFAAKPSTPISLKHLIYFGLSGRNKSEREEGEKLLRGGNFLRTELPTRLAHRLRDLQSLPLSTMRNPNLLRVYELYLEAFETIRSFPPLVTLEDNDRFCAFMQNTLDKHRAVIPALAIGISESSPQHLQPTSLDTFMTRMLRSRISRRVVTSQHIALTEQFRARQRAAKSGSAGKKAAPQQEERVGVVETKLTARRVVERCRELLRRRGGPEVGVVMEGESDVEFAYIGEHLEFMLLQLLKNASEATIAAHGPEEATKRPITLTVVHGPRDLVLRISDQGGGLAPYGGLPPTPAPVLDSGHFLPPHTNPLPNPTPASGGHLVPQNIALTAERLDVFSFSHMRRAHLHLKAQRDTDEESDALKGILTLRKVAGGAGAGQSQTVDEMIRAETAKEVQADLPNQGEASGGGGGEDVFDAQMTSGIGLPLAKMFAEYFSGPAEAPGTGSLKIWTVQGFGSSATLSIPKFGHAS